MVNEKHKNIELLKEEIFSKKNVKSNSKWPKFKCYLSKKRICIPNFQNRHVYLETISVNSVKRSLSKICRSIFKSRYNGYEQFLTEDEKRFLFNVDNYSVVEGRSY